jgi:methionyl-tRNA formyltransferase
MSIAAVPTYPKRLVYLGTPALAAEPLHALVDAGFDVALVVTRVDKRRGRGSELAPSPVKAAATKLGIPVSHNVEDVLTVGADLGVVVAFGQLIKPHILEALPMVNLHFSLLPRWRGAAPMERALLSGDRETGVGLMQLEEGLDTGPLFAEVRTTISADDTGDSLRECLTSLGSEMLVRCLRTGLSTPSPQKGEPTYAAKLSMNDLRINWSLPASVIDRVIRLGGAWTTADGRRLKVVSATIQSGDAAGSTGQLVGAVVQTGDGLLRLDKVRPEGKGVMAIKDWLNGAGRSLANSVLGS